MKNVKLILAGTLAVLLTLTVTSSARAALMSLYKFDFDANDSGPLANHGTEMGTEAPGYVSGKFGEAIELDGIDQYVLIPDSPDEVGAGDYTVAFWINSTANGGHLMKTGSHAPGNDDGLTPGRRSMDSAIAGDGFVYMQVDADTGAGPSGRVPDLQVIDGTWHHLALVRDTSLHQIEMFVDGMPASGDGVIPTAFFSGNDDATSPGEPAFIGADMTESPGLQPTGFVNSLFDDVAFFDHALQQAEIQEIINNGFPGNIPENRIRIWRVDQLGDWHSGGNWIGGVPNSDRVTAIFDDAISQARTVVADEPVTVNAIQFNNSNSYIIAGASNLNLLANTTPEPNPQINVLSGTHEFQVRVKLHDDTNVDVASNSTIIFSNALDLMGQTLTKTGAGEIAIRNDLFTSGGTVNCQEGTCSGSGTISGDLNNQGGTISPGNSSGLVAAVVPEPTTIMLLAAGAVVIGVFRYRRRSPQRQLTRQQ